MSEQKQEQNEELAVTGPGQLLKDARQRANLSVQHIADKLHLKKALIENIECDNYELDISLTFLKGYIKLYAKQVDVAESEVMTAFDNLKTSNKEPVKVKSFSRRVANQANDDRLMLVTYLVILVVIALVVVWWFQQDKDISTSQEALTGLSEPLKSGLLNTDTDTDTDISVNTKPDVGVNTPQSLVKEFNVTSESTVPDVQLNVTKTRTQDITLPESNGSESPKEDENTNQESELVELIFEFSGDCWMNLSDATGENIAYGVKVKGRVMPVSGIPPFTVTLGASEVVKISYAGEPVDLSFLTPGNIAKFNLPLSE